MKRTKLKETLSIELSISESVRFRALFERARKRNSLCGKSHLIRELLGLSNYDLLTERDRLFWTTEPSELYVQRHLDLDGINVTTPVMDTGLADSEAPPSRRLKRDKAKMRTAAAKIVRGRKTNKSGK